MRAVTFFDGDGMHDGTLDVRDGRLRLLPRAAPTDTPHLDGVITGLFTDHHVHLQLVDPDLLPASRLGRVIDLGADPDWIAEVSRHRVTVHYAGPFLTAPGGYPSDRAWAPTGSVREIADAEHAARTVDELAAAEVSLIKVVAHSDAGPVIDDDAFRAVVRQAAVHRLPVVAHAEGAGQAQRAVRLGATRLAHAPFSERLTDTEIAAQAASASWISTLAIHDDDARAVAIDNVRRFVAAGGEVLYGTDMGNGTTPVDLREAEIDALRAAGLDGLDLLTALSPADPLAGGALLLLPDGDPNRARRLTAADIDIDTDTDTDSTEP
ncbi:hydrolase [Microbacterium sp. Re1]|uniref:Hydrolase n=1 Tax=Microbacterium commune TaxID=2762219 RepID=A0ABR8W5J3_9MICO|nr:hydrolase [Microbacterium commune]MBD8012256.1 hydrolase [Microbacterium commune]